MTEWADSPVVRFDLGDGVSRHGFLSVGEVKQLERLFGMGVFRLAGELETDPKQEQVQEVIRLGLIGGGMDPKEALELAEYYCQPPRPMSSAYTVATVLVAAWWRGIPKEEGGGGNTRDPDEMMAFLTADAVQMGISVEAMNAMSLGEFLRLRKEFMRDGDGKPDAPPAETLRAILG